MSTKRLTKKRKQSPGRVAEDVLATALEACGVQFERQALIGPGLYGWRLRVDFLVSNIAAFPEGVIIESKWQDVGGTADEKFPYLVENIRRVYPVPAIVIVAGGGCRPGALTWIRGCVDGTHLIGVYGFEAFLSWLLRSDKTEIPLPSFATMPPVAH